MPIENKYFNEELGVYVKVYRARKPRKEEITWPAVRGSIAYNGAKVANLKSLGYSKACSGGR